MREIKRETPRIDLRGLHGWYGRARRDLPFRGTSDSYLIWVSEVMLQQTRVAAMLPKYIDFTRRFPDMAALAAAPEEQVLAAWQGLGYYSRARNLRKGARYVLAEHGGEFPSDLEAALKIPGVGPYTAAAVLSIALGQATAVLDGNVKRVLDRLLGLTETKRRSQKPAAGSQAPAKLVSDAEYKERADSLMRGRGRAGPGDHNQAMMELGATVCVPGRPNCAACPLRTQCATYAQDPTGELAAGLPPKQTKAAPVALGLDAFLIYNRRRTKLLIAREQSSRFFRGLWFFPYRFSGEVYFEESESPGLGELLAGDGIDAARVYAKGFRHSITHHRITGRVIRGQSAVSEARLREIVRPAGPTAKGPAEGRTISRSRFHKASRESAFVDGCEWRWVPIAELHDFVVSSLARKIETIASNESPDLF
ncbi:MAG: A/G-specific adenine glycosylase [Leptospirales bacterium]